MGSPLFLSPLVPYDEVKVRTSKHEQTQQCRDSSIRHRGKGLFQSAGSPQVPATGAGQEALGTESWSSYIQLIQCAQRLFSHTRLHPDPLPQKAWMTNFTGMVWKHCKGHFGNIGDVSDYTEKCPGRCQSCLVVLLLKVHCSLNHCCYCWGSDAFFFFF